MRHKPIPPPPDELDGVRAARDAVPLVPGSEDDCCARLLARLYLPGRDVAATWLAFLGALGLVREGPTGFTRARGAPDDEAALAEAFVSNVYGARETVDALSAADGPLDAAAVADRLEGIGPGWERRKHGPDWPTVWRDRTARLLDWLVLLGLAERVDGRYAPVEPD